MFSGYTILQANILDNHTLNKGLIKINRMSHSKN